MSKDKVYGIGINDVPNGSVEYPTAYWSWVHKLERGYSPNFHKKSPTYKGVSVHVDWWYFSTYLKWWLVNSVTGYDADKDILVPGNQVYSSATVRYVPPYLNALLTDRRNARGACPLGVDFHRQSKKYRARCNQMQVNGTSKLVHLGYFKTEELAHEAWQKGKIVAIENAIKLYRNEPMPLREIIAALKLRIRKLKNDIRKKRITVKL